MTRRSVALVAVATACVAAAGFGVYRAGWFGSGPSAPTLAAPVGGEPESWSATIVRTFEVNGVTTASTTRFARSGVRTRLEWTEGNGSRMLIVRPDLSVSWLVDLSTGTYIETTLGPTGAPVSAGDVAPLSGPQVEAAVTAGSPADGFAVRRERSGDETVDGHACLVYRSRLEAIDGSASEATVWEAVDFAGLAIRSEIRSASGGLVRTELQRLQRDPDPAEFELPPGVRLSGQTP